MKKIEIVKKEQEFSNIISNAQRRANKYYSIFFAKNLFNYSRFGVTISTKFGNAVTRNQYKRRIKKIIDESKFMFEKGFDYIIIIKKACIGLSYLDLKNSFIAAYQEEKK